jgi:hypothetical protein
MPIFPGLPNFCRSAARTPIKAPTHIIPQRVAKKFFNVFIQNLLLLSFSCLDFSVISAPTFINAAWLLPVSIAETFIKTEESDSKNLRMVIKLKLNMGLILRPDPVPTEHG